MMFVLTSFSKKIQDLLMFKNQGLLVTSDH